MEPKEQPLTIEDRDNLSSDLLVDLHAAEKHMQMIELSFVHEIQATENYKRLVKEKGKTNAEVILYAKTHRILRQDDRYRVNQVMQAFAAAHRAMQKIFNAAIENGVEDGYIVSGFACHHIIPFESAKTQAEMERLCYDPNNCVLLCIPCHVRVHQELGSKTKAKVQERRAQAFERWKDKMKGE